MVGKKILLNDMAEKVAGGTLKYFEVMWKEKAPKKEKKTREKKTLSGFHPGHFSSGNSLKAMISFHVLKFTSIKRKIVTVKTSDREIQYQYDVRIMLRNMDYK